MATLVAGVAVAVALARPGFAAILECASADVPCLIAAINTANANGEVNMIRLAAGTYTLTAVDNDGLPDAANGLPSITSALTIAGAGAENTIIEREATAPRFRLLHVGQAGLLKLESLTLRGGVAGSQEVPAGGAGLLSRGTAIISQSTVADNTSRGGASGGGILSFGRLVIAKSTIANNRAAQGGGLFSEAGVTIVNSTISGNIAQVGGGLFTVDGSPATIIGSTIADNSATEGNGGGLFAGSSSSSVAIINSTISRNRVSAASSGAALALFGRGIIVNSTIAYNGRSALLASSALGLQNTILADTSIPGFPACAGAVTSLDNNFFNDPKCAVTLLPQDLTGDPGLGAFTDDGTPGQGHVPLVARSPALGAANDAACLPTDQRGQRRVGGGCDIGAIEGPRP